MPPVETETPSQIESAESSHASSRVEETEERTSISERITRYGAYDRLEG